MTTPEPPGAESGHSRRGSRWVRWSGPLRARGTPSQHGPAHDSQQESEPLPPVGPDSGRDVQFVAFEPRWLRRGVVSILIIVTLYTVGIWLFGAIAHFLFLLLLAWLTAIAMEPSIRWFERRGWRRGFGTGITLFAGLVLTTLTLVLLGGVFSAQSAQLIQAIPTVVVDTVDWLNSRFGLDLSANEILEQLNVDASQLASVATEFAGGLVGALTLFLSVTFDFLTVLVFSFFIAADGPRLRRTVAAWLPPRQQRVMITVWDISLAKTGGFVVSKAILASVSAVSHTAFFWMIDLPYWLPMGIFAGLTSQLIPGIGTYIGVAVPILLGALDKPLLAVWVVIFATVYQQIENYVLTPRISRATMDIHPAVALGAVFVGAAIWGPVGALIGIPIAAAVLAVTDTYGRRYELIAEMREPHERGGEATGEDMELEHATRELSRTSRTMGPKPPNVDEGPD